MCSKAMVFVDFMYVPHPHPLVDGEDVVFFDPLDKQGFVDKINYYLTHKDEARRIAMNGYYKAMRYHRYINRVDFILNTVSILTDPSYKVRAWEDTCTVFVEMKKKTAQRGQRKTWQLASLSNFLYVHADFTELGHSAQGGHDALVQSLLHPT